MKGDCGFGWGSWHSRAGGQREVTARGRRRGGGNMATKPGKKGRVIMMMVDGSPNSDVAAEFAISEVFRCV